MRRFLVMGLLVGCPSAPIEIDKDTTDCLDGGCSGDADSDADSDSDTDTDTDTDAHTGSTSDTDPPGCDSGTAADLTFWMEARDQAGPCSLCTGSEITLAVTATNPCPSERVLDLTHACMVPRWDLRGANGSHIIGMINNPCFEVPTQLVVPALESHEESYDFDAPVVLEPDTYQGEAEIQTLPPLPLSVTFQLQ